MVRFGGGGSRSAVGAMLCDEMMERERGGPTVVFLECGIEAEGWKRVCQYVGVGFEDWART
jgi:hypothetical protein